MTLNTDQLLSRLLLVGAVVLGSPVILTRGFAESADTSSITGSIAPEESGKGNAMNFQADLFTGRFSYAVPIVVAPGRQGAEPSLALGYNSAGANGWCGVGWSLEVGFIQRDTHRGVPIQWSPNSPTPLNQYDDAKGFVVNFAGVSGNLVLVSATNQNPIVYRQEVEMGFMTYNFYTNNYWEVVDKSGNVFYFGEGPTNRMDSTRANWPAGVKGSTFRWALNRVVDANGNQTFLRYMTNTGALYLTNISYNANSNLPTLGATHTVDFVLGDRPDTNISFVSGYRVTTTKRLTEIQVKVDGNNVRKYSLGYASSPSTMRSLLTCVTNFGSDYSNSLPPITFNYQVKPAAFESTTNEWPTLYSQGDTSDTMNGIRSVDSNGGGCTRLEMIDMDGDGLPDRVMRDNSNPQTHYAVQRNTGSGFAPATSNFFWGPIEDEGNGNHATWNAVTGVDTSGATVVDTFDINGDGYADRIVEPESGPFTNFLVQLNPGLPGENILPNPSAVWGPVTNDATSQDWRSIRLGVGKVDMIDMNGDGLPDRVNRSVDHPLDRFRVQLNTGNGFSRSVDWYPLDSQNNVGDVGWNSISCSDGNSNMKLIMADINGDGLPDRVMRKDNTPYTCFVVQLNNGAGFEAAENWGGTLDNQGQGTGSEHWCSPIGGNGTVESTLLDINGDGLPDRVMRSAPSPYTNGFVVQLNTGSGFASSIVWGPLKSQGKTVADWNIVSGKNSGDTYLDMFDINGDGLPDRVMRRTDAPYDRLVVQLNKGPFPDLLSSISNNLGGSVQVTYIPSTTLNNRDKDWTGDPLTAGAKSLLPFNVWVVSQVFTSDGFGNTGTNSYAFKGGYFNAGKREFRGFSQAEVIDPFGATTRTYFHQSGGRDNSAMGEYQDQGSVAKKGKPFRVELLSNDGKTNQITLTKVDEVQLHSNGWYFPFVAQTIVMNYEGLGSYRASANQMAYDFDTGNLTNEINWGEVANVDFAAESFTTSAGTAKLYTWISYAAFSNPFILNKPSSVKLTSDSAASIRLKETRSYYDSRGNMLSNEFWLDSASAFIPGGSTTYDQYGNPLLATDASGVTKATTYDSTYVEFPVTQITATFTNLATYDPRNGDMLTATDAKGLVASNTFDIFFRLTATYISTNAYGPASLWKSKLSYSLGGIVSGVSYNSIHKQVNDAVDTVNGFETYMYMDGVGRAIQSRTESETGQFRIADTLYDSRGVPVFQTIQYAGSGADFSTFGSAKLGKLTEYDGIGRAFRVTPMVQVTVDANRQIQSVVETGGDTGSPVGPAITAFVDGNNPWACVGTDAGNQVRKSYRDALGHVTSVIEVTAGGNYTTTYGFDLLGYLTNVVDNAGNTTRLVCDSLGRKTSMIDPDLGTWTYTYDNAGRLTQQIDARSNKLKFFYNDPLGRMSSKEIYNSGGGLVGTVSFTYDASDDGNYTVLKGQLYKVTDLQGTQRNSYDLRGRVVKVGRSLNINSIEYVTQSTYDDADRLLQITYPGNAATIQYTYDTGGNLSQVKSLSGTGSQETFYTAQGFNDLGQINGWTLGNGEVTTNLYYANSKRIQRVQTKSGGTMNQDLSYTFDKVASLTSIGDGVFVGSASAGVSNIVYDDLHRLVSLTSVAHGAKSYAYNSIGNILTNQDFGSGLYLYGSRPHAVTNANSKAYSYDACGNMIKRGSQTLTYDEENQLIQADGVAFGYADGGSRLWRSGTNGYTIWIGGIYEINNGKVLCHVMAGSQRIATFEPQCNALLGKVLGQENWLAASTTFQSIMNWPFQEGRAPLTSLLVTLCGILGICIAGRRQVPLPRLAARRLVRPASLWKQGVTFAALTAFLLATTETRVAAVTYTPVFYYYHVDNLGSSNVLTDRTGSRVQHYEYNTFGSEGFKDNTSAFPISNRYTGQILDEETGLYYYNARYYDPELGRFVQADTIVPGENDPQGLNRYSYVNNNPLNKTDPSGHGSILGLFKAVFNAEARYWSSPETWKNVAIGFALGGPKGALGSLLLGHIATEIGAVNGYLFGKDIGAYSAFAVTIAGTIVLAALGCAGTFGNVSTIQQVVISLGAAASIASSSAGFAGNQKLSEALGYASIGISVAGTLAVALRAPAKDVKTGNSSADLAVAKSDYPQAGAGSRFLHSAINNPILNFLGKIWALPYTILGTVYGLLNLPFGATLTFGHNGIEFHNVFGAADEALTLGNAILYAKASPGKAETSLQMKAYGDTQVQVAIHEMGHTYGYERLGIFYLPGYAMGGHMMTIDNRYEAAANIFGRTH